MSSETNEKVADFLSSYVRAVGRSENPGVPVLYGGHNLPPLVETGLTDLPKFGGAMVPQHPQGRHPCSSCPLM